LASLLAPAALRVIDALALGMIRAERMLFRLHQLAWGAAGLHWYDHLYDHLAGPERWMWIERGFLAASLLRPGDTVLDACCGDGTYAGLFLAPRAARVDAIDADERALARARRRWRVPGLTFRRAHVLADPFPAERYDRIFFLAGLEYFTREEGDLLLDKFARALAPGGILFGLTPVWSGGAPSYAGLRATVASAAELAALLRRHFPHVRLERSRDPMREQQYFTCSASPL